MGEEDGYQIKKNEFYEKCKLHKGFIFFFFLVTGWLLLAGPAIRFDTWVYELPGRQENHVTHAFLIYKLMVYFLLATLFLPVWLRLLLLLFNAWLILLNESMQIFFTKYTGEASLPLTETPSFIKAYGLDSIHYINRVIESGGFMYFILENGIALLGIFTVFVFWSAIVSLLKILSKKIWKNLKKQ